MIMKKLNNDEAMALCIYIVVIISSISLMISDVIHTFLLEGLAFVAMLLLFILSLFYIIKNYFNQY